MSNDPLEAARRAKARFRALAPKGLAISGIGITTVAGKPALKVNLPGQPATDLPNEIDGVPVVYEVVGVIRPRRGSP